MLRCHGAITRLLIVFALLPALTSATCAAEPQQANVELSGVWARPAIQGGNSAIYFALTNTGARPLLLIHAASDVAGITEVHETVHEDSEHAQHGPVMHMHHLPEIEIAPGETVLFKPGGKHVMLLELKQALRVGDRIPFTLYFAANQTASGNAIVRLAAE